MKRWSYIALLWLFPTFLFSQSIKLESIRLFEKDLVILGEGRRGPYILPDSLIVDGSMSVFLDDIKLSSDQYTVDYIDGELRFFESIATGTRIRLRYKISPYVLQKSYYHRRLHRRVFGAPTEMTTPDKPSEAEIDYASGLTKSGSITRGVTVGSNRGLKVNSSLNINVSGKVGDNVDVVAALTDQTTPIQPEGTTQNLQEIDKVFIQIKSPNLTATMGDFHIDYSQSQFARYNRKLQGAMGEAKYENIEAKVSAAVTRGKYISQKISGQEGNQGPYQLKGDRGQIDIIILAGTERVYIDGELMVRGQTNDYIIDYAAAQITFTRHRLITSDSRITVDFQYSDEQYRRNLYSSSVSGTLWKDKLKLGAIYLHEADDKNNPLDFTLTDEYKTILEQAGDDPLQAVLDGATFVGTGEGRYIKQDSIFVYVGEDEGDYNITFSDVGDGVGGYQYTGNAVFEWVGANNGRYAPVILLPLPKRHDIVDFNFDFSPVAGIRLNSELGISNYNQNSFSTLDSDDNMGIAQNWTLALQPEQIRLFGKSLGSLTVSGHYKKVNDLFRDIDRTTEIEYNRKWDLPESTQRGEVVKEFRSQYSPFNGFDLRGEYGIIEKSSSFTSDRMQLGTHLKRNKWPLLNYRIERINRDNIAQNQNGEWWRQRGDAEWTIWKIKPIFEYEGENKKENWSDSLYTGFKFDDITGGMEFRPFSKLLLSGRISQRDDKDYVGFGTFTDRSFANTQNVQLQLQQIKSLNIALDYTHRRKTYASAEQSDSQTDLAELRMQYSPWQRAVMTNLTYQLSNTATARKERVYIKVPEGEGNYRFDEELNEYVYDPLGNYILRILTTDQLIPTIELKMSTRLRLQPDRFFKKAPESSSSFFQQSLRALSSETYVAIEERSQTQNMRDIYLLNLNSFRKPGETIFGYLQLRQDLYVFERNRDLSFRFRYLSRDELNNQFLEGGEDRLEREQSARVTARISQLFASQTELTHKRTARLFNYEGRQDRDISATQIKSDLSVTPLSVLKLALEGRFSSEEDRVYDIPTQVKSYALIPRVTYAFRKKGRLRAEFEWSYVDAEPKDRILPYEMANGRSIGRSVRWDVRFDYKLSQVIQATLSYSGRNEPERDYVIHTGRAQVTAAFR